MTHNIMCTKNPTCANYPRDCVSCTAMSHYMDPYPHYLERINKPEKRTRKVKIFDSIYADNVEIIVNEFITDKNVVDIQYQYNGHRHSVLIVYEED